MTDWNITEAAVDHPDSAAILREYVHDVASRYYGREATTAEVDEAQTFPPTDAVLTAPTGAFLLARVDGAPAGCVGVRIASPGVTELTRMYVRPAHRGTGGGPRLVAAAEEAARGLGSKLMRLDTRNDLVEARALYARTGYVEVAPFNSDKYAEHWFAKPLT